MARIILNIGLQSLLIFGFVLNIYGQDVVIEEVRPEIEVLVKQIIETGMYTGGSIEISKDAFVPAPSKADYAFHKMKKIATEEELILLTNHKHSAVKCYAFIALAESKSSRTFEVLVNHLTDEDYVTWHMGCIQEAQQIKDFFIDVLFFSHRSKNTYKLNATESFRFDSLIVLDTTLELRAKPRLISRLKSRDIYYQEIKKMYQRERTTHSLICLAKYRKKEDHALIIDLLSSDKSGEKSSGLLGVNYFPAYEFFPFVEKVYEETFNIEKDNVMLLIRMYSALSQYKTEYSRKLMMDAIRNTKGKVKKNHIQSISIALGKEPSMVYFYVLKEIEAWRLQKTNWFSDK